MIVKDNDDTEYLLDGDIMREAKLDSDDSYSFYYAFDRTKNIYQDDPYDPNSWNISCAECDCDGVADDSQEFPVCIKAGILTPTLAIGCRRFSGDNLKVLAEWLGGSNPELKAYIDKRLKEIQEYYDRRDKSCEETSTTPTGN